MEKNQGYDPKGSEENILRFWKDNKILQKIREKNKNGKDYYFLDGPPYTSGKVHIGTAWNKALKDMVLRYKRACGFNVWDRAGYDMHGLPIEHKVQAKLKLAQKEDILAYGIEKFMEECKSLAVENLLKMNEDFIRLGVWMDFENAYQSISERYTEGVWWLIKRAHEQNRLYEGFRPIHWDYEHQSALAKHELEYETVKEKSIFLKFKVKNERDTYLVVWTTTPWTIAYNLGVMVNPELDYVKADVGGEKWIVAKGLAAPVITFVAEKKFEITEEMKGESLLGLEYVHPFYEQLKVHYDRMKKEHKNIHTVVLSTEYVTLGAGSGLVHMAPGCGPEDYEVGHEYDVPAWNNLMEDGRYPKDMGKFSGWHAKHDNDKFIEELDRLGSLIKITEVEHEYPFGQRSHKPVVFRATKQWFFRVEDLKGKMIEENNKVKWIPEAAYNAFNSWLENLRDNSISKQRYWGTPLPIWRASDDDMIVIGSKQELEKLSGVKVDELHIPWIDNVVIKKDGKEYRRVPDVLDVWVDAGTASWNCLDYPHQKKDFDRLFPAEFILEGKDQIRGWYNLLMVTSILGMGKGSFKNVYMHGFVQDAQGRKMSKSLGNSISPYEVIDKYSADTLRYYMIGGANPGIDINYNFDEMKVRNRNLTILWNLHNYLIDLSKTYSINPVEAKILERGVEEKLMLSRLHSSIKECTMLFDGYRINEVPYCVENLFLELSRDYIQKVREKITSGSKEERETSIAVIYNVLFETLKMITPITPFMAEAIYIDMKSAFNLEKESISLYDWPPYDERMIDKEFENSFIVMDELVQVGLFVREKAQLGVRWPLREMIVETKDAVTAKVLEDYSELVKKQLNMRKITVKDDAGFKAILKPEYKALKKDYERFIPKIIAKLMTESSESILKHLDKEGDFSFKLDGEQISLKREHFSFEYSVPDKYLRTEFKKGVLYIDRELDEELEAEGFTREVMRRIQSARKDAGLQKLDRIKLCIACSKKIQFYITKNRDMLVDKVGASELTFIDSAEGSFSHSQDFSVKNEKVKVLFTKI